MQSPTLQRRQIEALYALSPLQQGLLFTSQVSPRDGLYHMQLVVRLEGELRPRPLALAWEAVAQRHGALRTLFSWRRLEEPRQAVLKPGVAALPVRWIEMPEALGAEPWEALLAADRRHGFPLDRAPLARVTAVRRGPRQTTLLWSFHHIILDGWSAARVLAEVLRLYAAAVEAEAGGEALTAAQLAERGGPQAAPFQRYVRWLEARDGAADEGWWRAHLEGFEAPTPLPGERRRKDGSGTRSTAVAGAEESPGAEAVAPGPRWQQVRHQVADEVVAGLGPALSAAGLTAAAAVQGLWMLLLARYSGEPELCAGMTVAGRPPELPGSQEMVGLLIQTLPLRARWSPRDSARSWLQRLQLEQAEARERGSLSLPRLRQLSSVPASEPLFESLVIFESYPVDRALNQAPPGLTIASARLQERIEYPLSLLAVPRGGGLSFELLWDEERVEGAVARELPQRLEALLVDFARAHGAGQDPRLGELRWLSPSQQQALLDLGKGPQRQPLPGSPEHLGDLGRWGAEHRGDAVAVSGPGVAEGEERWTYRQLEAQVEGFGGALAAAGVTPGATVALAVQRNVTLPSLLLALYRRGTTVVPLDVHQPATRRRLILEASGARWLLTDAASRGSAQQAAESATGLELLSVESLRDHEGGASELSSREPGSREPGPWEAGSWKVRVYPEALAYRIFTSGSTGVPKGVEVSHGAALAFLESVAQALPLGAEDTLAAVTTVAFDISVLELLLPLALGAQVAVVAEGESSDGEALGRRLDAVGATALQATPATWRLLRAAGWRPPQGFLALCGGEAMPPALAAHWTSVGSRLWNLYGPTETAVWSATGEVTAADGERSAVPVGRPLAGERLAVLDARGEPLPTGARGELWIGGAGLARGYAGRPAITAEAFRPAPSFDSSSVTAGGERLYRSGDLARWLSDGRLEIVGRRDDQVKLRGFRIEPGEIERVLERQPTVAAAAVVLRQEGEPFLAAYVAAAAVEASSELLTDLRQACADALPAYMVPTAWELLPALPLGASGKVDRRALLRRPAPASAALLAEAASAGSRAPSGPLEETLSEIWGDVLETGPVAPELDVFALGAHSLSALQAAARLRKVLEVPVEVVDLFEAPSVAELARRLAPRLQGEKSGEDGALPGAEGSSMEEWGVGAATFPRLPADQPARLSSSQLRQWFLDQLEPGLPAYNLPTAVRLRGEVDLAALERSLNAVVARHDILRTVYTADDGEPLTRVLPVNPVPLPVVDLRRPPGETLEAQQERVRQRLGEEMTASFDLASGPLLRASLLRLGGATAGEPERWIFHLTLHHIAGDGWSLGVLLREVMTLYGAAVKEPSSQQPLGSEQAVASERDLASVLAPLALQYRDYAAWQREWAEGPQAKAALEWWLRHLDGGSPPLDLPLDRPRPAVQTFRGARAPFRLPSDLSAQLSAHGRRRGATLFMLLSAALNTLFFRLTGARDLTLGTFLANRPRPELEALVGFFVNTLPLRVTLEADSAATANPGFDEILARVRRVSLGVFARQEVAFENLLEAVDPRRDLARTPLFQAMLVVQNLPITGALESLKVPGLDLEVVEFTGLGRSNFDLTLWVTEVGSEGASEGDSSGIGGALEYNRDLIEESTAVRWLGHLETLLKAALESPRLPLEALPMLTAAERSAVVESWPLPTQRAVEPLPVHLLAARWARQTPEASAVETPDGRRWTYRELQLRVETLAARLAAEGLAPEEPVGLFVQRSPEAIAGLLAVLWAGGSYVPMDPAAPAERLAYQLEDSGARILLASRALGDRAPAADTTVILENVLEQTLEEITEGAPGAELARGQRSAYVLYTSGTTGRPKGVVVSHSNLSNYAQCAAADYGFEPGQRLLQFAALSFDNSGEEIYGALVSGSTLVLRDELMVSSPQAFLQTVEELGITVLNLPTAFWHEVVEVLEERPLPAALRVIIVGGETMRPERLAQWRRRAPSTVAIYNTYGPTEATIGITAWPASAVEEEVSVTAAAELVGDAPSRPASAPVFRLEAEDGGLRAVPLGRPMANGRLYVLERSGAPAPTGIPGQLFAGGPGVTRGYLGRPALTAERFVPDPYSPEPGGRLYATGDRARWLATGDLAFLGRVDHQVKVRGYRIELGEIESALQSLPGVAEAVVQVRTDAAGNPRLAGFVGAAVESGSNPGAAAAKAAELRSALAQHLPSYMVPDAVMVLAALPRLPSGKLHIAGLPEPNFERDALGTEYVAPRTEMEELMAELFVEVLGVERAGAFDDFFALGGHSLLATRLTSRLAASFDSELPVRLIFEAPTPARLALAVEEHLIAELEAMEE
ncbi:MAG: amino acid adenylation domain-containing protein [Acidobacteriota bacterium]